MAITIVIVVVFVASIYSQRIRAYDSPVYFLMFCAYTGNLSSFLTRQMLNPDEELRRGHKIIYTVVNLILIIISFIILQISYMT